MTLHWGPFEIQSNRVGEVGGGRSIEVERLIGFVKFCEI